MPRREQSRGGAGPTPAGQIDRYNAPGVLSVLRRLNEEALKKQQAYLLFANIEEASFEYEGIRQLGFDADGEHRLCAMDRKLILMYYPHTHRPQERNSAPVEYQIDRHLNGDRGSYVTCKCD